MLGNHGIFTLPDEPDFEDNGFKWWGLKSDAPKGVKAAYVEKPDGDKNYVLLDDKGVFYETKNAEQLFVRAGVESPKKGNR